MLVADVLQNGSQVEGSNHIPSKAWYRGRALHWQFAERCILELFEILKGCSCPAHDKPKRRRKHVLFVIGGSALG